MKPKHRVLMVCLGNICRSPLAEGILKTLVEEAGIAHEFHIDSAGTAAYHVGSEPDSRSIEIGRRYGIELDHLGRQFTASDFDDFDWILVMDHANHKNVIRLATTDDHRERVHLISAFDSSSEGRGKIVEDPYYGGIDGFEVMYRQLRRCLAGFLKHVQDV